MRLINANEFCFGVKNKEKNVLRNNSSSDQKWLRLSCPGILASCTYIQRKRNGTQKQLDWYGCFLFTWQIFPLFGSSVQSLAGGSAAVIGLNTVAWLEKFAHVKLQFTCIGRLFAVPYVQGVVGPNFICGDRFRPGLTVRHLLAFPHPGQEGQLIRHCSALRETTHKACRICSLIADESLPVP